MIRSLLCVKYVFNDWLKLDDDNEVIRLVTGWGTKEEEVKEFLLDLQAL